jgi:hypothetical protein
MKTKLLFKTSRRQCTMLHTKAYKDYDSFLRIYMHTHFAKSKYALTLNNKVKLIVAQDRFAPAITFTECFYR